MTGDGEICSCVIKTPLGEIKAAARSDALVGLWFTGQKHFPSDTAGWQKKPDYPIFVSLKSWLEGYFSRKNPKSKFALSPQGTEFQQAVWKLLLSIPYGKTCTYGELAERLSSSGIKTSARAVGGAVGRNPISLLIPCHRVLGSGGNLTGYAGGLDKKRALLELEQE